MWPWQPSKRNCICRFQSTHPWRMWLTSSTSRTTTTIFQSTHPWRMWRPNSGGPGRCRWNFNPHIREGCDIVLAALQIKGTTISIHTSMKDVTRHCPRRFDAICHFNPHIHEGCDKNRQPWIFIINYFNPHIRKGCDGLKKNTHICSARSLCGANRFLPNLFLFSSLRLAMLKTLFQRQRSGSVHFIFDCTSHCRESVYIDFDWLRLLTHSRTYELYYIHLFPLL